MRNNRPEGLRTWIEIDKKTMRHNYQSIRGTLSPKTKLMAVVKSNAYGHSLVDFSREVVKLGADWLGVDSLVEGVRLREEGITLPILVLGYTLPENFKEAVGKKISIGISSAEQIRELIRLKTPCAIHLKIDTGMHRQGFFLKDIPSAILQLKKAPWIKIEGVFTHLAGKDPYNLKENRSQIEIYNNACALLSDAGFIFIRHLGATWGTVAFPEAHFDMVRVGIGLYGMWPSEDIHNAFSKKMVLKPILAWKTILSEIKKLPRSGGIGYEFTEYLKEGTIIGICPIGYWHGYPRALSAVGNVLVRGIRAKILGRVSMDMIAIDLSKIKNAKEMDEVVLIGKNGNEEITAEEFTSRIPGSSHYEVVTRINPLIKRIYK